MRGWEGRKEEKLYRRQESLKIRPFPGEPLASLSSLFLPFFSSSLPPSASPRFARKVKPPLPLPFPDEASNDGPRCVLTAAKSSRKYLRSYSFPPRFLTGRQRLEVIPSIPIRQAGRFPPKGCFYPRIVGPGLPVDHLSTPRNAPFITSSSPSLDRSPFFSPPSRTNDVVDSPSRLRRSLVEKKENSVSNSFRSRR